MGRSKVKALSRSTARAAKYLSSYWIYLVMALVLIGISVGGSIIYNNEDQRVHQDAEDELTTIAQSKVDQITEWRSEILSDANSITYNPFFTAGIAQWLTMPSTESRETVLKMLATVEREYPYQDILVVDVNGKVLLNLNNRVDNLSNLTLAQLAIAFKEHKAIMVDFHPQPPSNSPYLDVISPLFLQKEGLQQAIGALVFNIDPSLDLYPMVQYWPVSSNTAEAFLVERDGDQVLFLNELRHQKDTALKLRIPLSQQDVPAVKAVLGQEGTFEGKDYRGVEVLSALKHIPDSPWHIVAKIDTDEAFSAWHAQGRLMIAFIVMLIVVVLAAAGVFWQRRQRLTYRALYQAEVERKALASHFDYLVKYANDIIILVDDKENIVEANDRALEAHGYTRDEMLSLTIADIMAPEGLPMYHAQMQEIAEKGSDIAEAINRRKDGSLFPVEISVRAINIDNKQYMQGIARDITKRKKMENQLKAANRLYALLSDTNQAIVKIKEREKLFRTACQIAVDIGKFRMAWIGLVDQESGDIKPVAYYGHEEGYLKTFLMNIKAEGSNTTPTISAIKQGKVATQDSIGTDVKTPWYEEALKRGYHSLAAVPLKLKDKVIGNFNLYAETAAFFSEEEQKLLSEIGDDLSYAITTIEMESERKRAEEALRESEKRYRTIIEDATDMIQSVRPDGSFVFVNQAWLKTLGYSESDLPGLNLFNIIHPESMAHCQQLFSEVMSGKSVQGISATFVAKDGRRILVEGNATPRFVGSDIVATQGIFRDVTERNKMEEERERTLEKLRKTVEGSIAAIAAMSETRDPYTAGHQQRVARLAAAIAKEMGLSPKKIEAIHVAGILHDVGKLRVPAEILSKPTKLNQLEMDLIKSHPEVGRDIVKTLELPWAICPIVLQHHERLNGSGYPDGLSGQDISLEARILAVADVVEAMASHRPYRPALGIDKALEEITRNKGTLYDADVVDACLKLFTEKGFKLEE